MTDKMRKTCIYIILQILILFSVVHARPDNVIAVTTKIALKSINVNVKDVEISDGEPRDGPRVLIITYYHSLSSEESQLSELIMVLEAGYAANINMDANIDEVVAIIAHPNGTPVAIIKATVRDASWFLRTKDSSGYFKKWKVTRLDAGFISNTAMNMGW